MKRQTWAVREAESTSATADPPRARHLQHPRRALVGVLTLVLGVGLTTGVASARPSVQPKDLAGVRLTTVKQAVNVRTGPSTSAAKMGQIQANKGFALWCQARGSKVNGSTLWDFGGYAVRSRVEKRGWVADYYVRTGTSGPVPGVQQGGCPGPHIALLPNGRLSPGQKLDTAFGFALTMQGDGNLVLTEGTTPLWATGTDRHPGAYAVMQTDGNLVVYSAAGPALWATGTKGMGQSLELDVQHDGNVVLYDKFYHPCWDRHIGKRGRTCG
jgi:hypothetical protein